MANQIEEDFNAWWDVVGSGLAIREVDDVESHTRKIARLAWFQAIRVGETLEPDNLFVTITERDCNSPFFSHGAIIAERYTAKCNALETINFAKSFEGKFGRVWIARLELIDELEEFIKLSKNI